MYAAPYSVEAVLITCICIQGGISILNAVKSYQMSVFKIDKIMSFINTIVPLLPVINYSTILISYDNNNLHILSFFIEWSVAVPLLLININKLLNLTLIQYVIPCVLSIIMTLTGYASALASNDTSIFTLFGIASGCYIAIFLFMCISYIKRVDEQKRETNFPSQLTQNQLNVFRTIFYTIATTWNIYPITFILWKTDVITEEILIICFATSDLITKGMCILVMLSYKLMLYQQNGFLVKAFRSLIKIHPIDTVTEPSNNLQITI